ncbi:hypothetical protein LIER_14734 [Lithospermum erythrorhizon]|uniref:Uncharacterized protein n=1 Tax=Lithospermum erythrorhizon TaxID=34254 RepID=A0AAV3Q3F0_LITER
MGGESWGTLTSRRDEGPGGIVSKGETEITTPSSVKSIISRETGLTYTLLETLAFFLGAEISSPIVDLLVGSKVASGVAERKGLASRVALCITFAFLNTMGLSLSFRRWGWNLGKPCPSLLQEDYLRQERVIIKKKANLQK